MNIFNEGKYKEKVKSIISVSKIYSIEEISKISNISEADTIKLVEKMIRNSNNSDYRIFKNAHINYQTNVIVLDETKSNTLIDKFGKMTGSIIDKFTPKELVKKEDWKCSYCGGKNASESLECSKCGAKKE